MLTSKQIMGLLLVPLALGVLIFGIKFMTVDKVYHKVDAIAAILLEHALTYDIDKRTIDSTVKESDRVAFTGFDAVKGIIAAAVASDKPIELNFVGFPYKSQNTQRKVIAPHLDMAEKHSLDYLNAFLAKIADVYGPGANLTIFTDGAVFCDIEGVDDAVVADYEKQLKQLVADKPHIKIKTLADLLPGKSPAAMRSVIENFSPSSEEFGVTLATDMQAQEEVALLEKRMAFEFDYPAGLEKLKHTTISDISKKLVHRGLQYSVFLSAFRPKEAIRLSVHYQPNVSKKMGIKLSQDSFITPWHGVLAVDSKGIARIEHLQDVVSRRRA